MRTRILPLTLALGLATAATFSAACWSPVSAQEDSTNAREKPVPRDRLGAGKNRPAPAATQPAPGRNHERTGGKEDEALRRAVQGYNDAFNKGDLEAVMAYWTSDPEFVDESGKSIRGREAVANLIRNVFEQHKGATIKTTVRSTRFVRPDVAVQEGTVQLTAPDGTADSGPYTAIWVRNDGKWQLARARDLPAGEEQPSNYETLRQLDWLTGDWVSEDKEHRVTFSCRWSKNHNFLVADQVIRLGDKEALELTHLIGWDPLREQIRSWVFDSRGGFGEGFWTRSGNEWVVESSGVLADGRQASSRSTWKFMDEKSWEWRSTDREIDDQPMPDVRVRYVRTQSGETRKPGVTSSRPASRPRPRSQSQEESEE